MSELLTFNPEKKEVTYICYKCKQPQDSNNFPDNDGVEGVIEVLCDNCMDDLGVN